jgi:hypothetical protein
MAKPLLLAPSQHKLALDISYATAARGISGAPTPEGSGDEGSIGGNGEYRSNTIAEIYAHFKVGHVYRIAADFENDAIDVILWDETMGAGMRARVEEWSFNVPRTHTGGGTGPKDHFL